MTRMEFNNDSWITYVSYDSETREMLVHTKAKEYACVGVPQEVYEAFEAAGSKGQFFNLNIKGRYQDAIFK